METVYIFRLKMTEQGTFGKLKYKNFELFTGELPWKDNMRNKSCIPEGEYECVPYISKKFGRVYHVLNVPGRSGILIHNGNFVGDRDIKNYQSHSWGCILLGIHHGYLKNRYGITQEAVLASKSALARFKTVLYKPFKLLIVNLWNDVKRIVR